MAAGAQLEWTQSLRKLRQSQMKRGGDDKVGFLLVRLFFRDSLEVTVTGASPVMVDCPRLRYRAPGLHTKPRLWIYKYILLFLSKKLCSALLSQALCSIAKGLIFKESGG